MSLGNKIAQYRKEKGMTQEAMAKYLEVTNQAVSKWESDQCCPDIQLLPRLADLFAISIDELFDREPKAAPQLINGLPWPDDDILRAVVYVGHNLMDYGHARKGLKLFHRKNVGGVRSDISVQCGDVAGNVDAGGNVTCGDVDGNVDTSGNVTCTKVNGSVDTSGNVQCHDVGGDVDTSGSVTCGNVGGNVDASSTVTCGNVAGDVDAGGSVQCGNVEGSVDAGGNVTCAGIAGDVDAGGKVTIRNG